MTSREAHGFLHLYTKRSGPRTLLLLHGTGGDERDLLPLADYLDPSAHILSPRGNVTEGGMPRFFARLRPGVFDTDEVRTRAAELASFVPAAAGDYGFDTGSVWAVGFSNGANVAAATLLQEPGIFAGAILLRPMLAVEPETVPDLSGTPVYAACGTRDEMITHESTEALLEHLEAAGADVTAAWSDAGHRFGEEELEDARNWLSKR